MTRTDRTTGSLARLTLPALALMFGFGAVLAWPQAGLAQTEDTALEESAAPAEEQAAPYDGDLERLSEILGSVHYLRALCGADEGQKWRSRMQALIDAEDPSPKRRAQMVNAFNRGYRGFQRTHTECTENSRLLVDRFMREGGQIASLIANRYGN